MFIERMKAHEVVTQEGLGTGWEKHWVYVFRSDGYFWFKSKVDRNSLSQGRARFQNRKILNWNRREVDGHPVRVYRNTPFVRLVARRDREVRKLLHSLEDLKPADFWAAIQLLSEAANVKLYDCWPVNQLTLARLQEVLCEIDLAILKDLRAVLTVVPSKAPSSPDGEDHAIPLAA
jgi:hypothetical protein